VLDGRYEALSNAILVMMPDAPVQVIVHAAEETVTSSPSAFAYVDFATMDFVVPAVAQSELVKPT